ncbi:MAG: hypothetical protein FD189_1065 [Elusimicrobia bacterium]|nr:MAG: hypothetical protein FD189_1065 [Elusimicrobiota bacterium]
MSGPYKFELLNDNTPARCWRVSGPNGFEQEIRFGSEASEMVAGLNTAYLAGIAEARRRVESVKPFLIDDTVKGLVRRGHVLSFNAALAAVRAALGKE